MQTLDFLFHVINWRLIVFVRGIIEHSDGRVEECEFKDGERLS
jgi:hypothetical protein